MIVQQDQAALIRSTTANILLAANTLAGDRVEQERVDGVAEGDTPRLIVMADQTAQTDSQAGTALTFQVTANLIVQALVEDTLLSNVVAKLDTLTAQIKDALFCDPAFTMLFQNVSSFRVVSLFKDGGAYITGDAHILISGTWREVYNPNPTTLLSGLNAKLAIGSTGTLIAVLNPPSQG